MNPLNRQYHFLLHIVQRITRYNLLTIVSQYIDIYDVYSYFVKQSLLEYYSTILKIEIFDKIVNV